MYLVLAIYPVLFLLQGIDFTDMGFNLSNQWLLLEDPASYVHGHLFYLSNLLGGVWLAITGPLGLLGAKLGWALVLYATMYAAFRTLEHSGGRAGLLVGLVVALLWNTRFGTTWVSYNSVTALFFTIAAFCLIKGLTSERRGFLPMAGALFGAATFVRFPNILAFGLILTVPLYAGLAGKTRTWGLKAAGRFILGYAGGIVVVTLLMLVLGHLSLYWESLTTRLTASVNDPTYEFSGGNLVGRLMQDYGSLLKYSAIAVIVLLSATRGLTGRGLWQIVSIIALAALCYVAIGVETILLHWRLLALLLVVVLPTMIFWMGRESDAEVRQSIPVAIGTCILIVVACFYLQRTWMQSVPGLLYVILGFRYFRVRDAGERLTTVVAALILAVTPLGSSNGMTNAIFGMWLAIPLAFITLFDEARAVATPPRLRRSAGVVAATACTSLLVVALGNASIAAYRDSSDRTRMTATVDHPFLLGALTTRERAIVLDELLRELPNRVAPGELLLLHGDCALVHLLSRTRPVLGTTWTGVYNARMFREKLVNFENSGKGLPAILVSRGSCRARDWPMAVAITRTGAETRQDLMEYMRRHAYQLRWQNNFFQIWESTQPSPGNSDVPRESRG